jgi:hypothetical protein
MPRRARRLLRDVIFLVAAFSPHRLHAQSAGATSVNPGDTGSITIAVTNSSASNGPLQNVGVAVSAPAFFQITTMAQPAVSLDVGQTQTFTVNYQLVATAPNGPFTVTLTPVTTTPNVDPTIAMRAQTFSFNTAQLFPLISFNDELMHRADVTNHTGPPVSPPPSTLSTNGIFTLVPAPPISGQDTGVGVTFQSVSLTRVPEDTGPQLPGSLVAASTPVLSGFFDSNNPLTPATYNLTVTNTAGITSSYSWLVTTLTGSLGSISSSFDSSANKIDTTLSLNFASGLGLQDVATVLERADGTTDGATLHLGPAAQPSFPYSSYPELAIPTSAPSISEYRAVNPIDKDGNSISYDYFAVGTSDGLTASSDGSPSGGSLDVPLVLMTPSPASFVGFLATRYLWTAGYAGTTAGSGPIVPSQPFVSYTAVLQQGPAPNSLTDVCQIVTGTLALNSSGPGGNLAYDTSGLTLGTDQPCYVNQPYMNLHVTLTPITQNSFTSAACAMVDPSNSSHCLEGTTYSVGPSGYSGDGFLAYIVNGQNLAPPLPAGQVSPGIVSLPLGYGITAGNLDVTAPGTLSAALASVPLPPPGYAWPLPGLGYTVTGAATGGGSFLGAPIQYQVNYPATGLAPAVEAQTVVFFTPNGMPDPIIVPDSINTSSHTLKFTTSYFGTFQLAYPIYSSSTVISISSGAFSFTSNQNSLSITNPAGDIRVPQLLNLIGSHGATFVSTQTWQLVPPVAMLTPPGLVQIHYSTAELSAVHVSTSALFPAQYSLATGISSVMTSVAVDPVNMIVSGYTPAISSASFFALLASTNTFAMPADLLPPMTTLLLGGTTVYPNSYVTASSTVPVTFSALDPPFGNSPVSGVAATYYAIDSTSPATAYTFPLVLSGQHQIYYWSVDNAGNVEPVNTVTITFQDPSSPNIGGMGLSADSSGQLWTVFIDSGPVSVARASSFGVFVASTTLPNADSLFPWSVVFDASNNPYVVGSAAGPSGYDLVALYAVAPNGSTLVSSTTYDSGFSNNNYVDVATGTWAAGAVQTSGAPDGSGSSSYALALWKVTPAAGLIQLTTTYSRAGLDLATDVAPDAAGHLWVTGFSLSPAPRSPRSFDLALWEFSSDGTTLLAGPFIREGYFNDFQTTLRARIAVSSSAIYVAAPRYDAANQSGLDLVVFSTSGVVQAESSWLSGDGASVFPGALFADNAGRLVATGGFDEGDGTLAGVWRYNTAGTLLSVAQLDAGGARGAASNANGLWLPVDGSTSPVADAGEVAASGALGDVEPPRTSLVAGAPSFSTGTPLYVSSTTALGFSAVDDFYAVGDGLGTVSLTEASVDGAPFAPAANVFSVTAEGLHAVNFYSIDNQGHAEVIESSSVAVDLTPPTATFVSSGAAYALVAVDPVSNGVASGVAGVNYYVNVLPAACADVVTSTSNPAGTCANPAYSGSFSLSTGTSLVSWQPYDNVGNFGLLSSSVVVNGVPGPSLPVLSISTAAFPVPAYASEIINATATGAGLVPGSALALERVLGSGGAWTTTGPLAQTRTQGALTQLTNGTVVAAGGYGGASTAPLAAAELYDPALAYWLPLPAMNAARAQFSAVALPNGRLLVIGGLGSSGSFLSSTEFYDPVAGGWTTTGAMANARGRARAVLLPNGNVLVAGGDNGSALASCELYNPGSGTWSAAASLNVARYGETLTLLPNGSVLAAGGSGGSGSLSSAEVYNPAANTWTVVGSLNTARREHEAVLLPTGAVLAAGGFGSGSSPLASAELYNPASGTWSAAASLNAARARFALAEIGQGVPLAIGGDGSSGALSSVEAYDPAGNAWAYSASLPASRDQVRATALYNGNVLAAGGLGGGVPTSSSTLYVPTLASSIVATGSAILDANDVAGNLNLSGATTGYWALAVQNPDGRQALGPALQVVVDTIPPVTTLLLDGVATSASTFSVTAADTFGFSAYDGGSGAAQTSYSIDGGSLAVYSAPFGVPHGTHALAYFSTDRAGNVEGVHVATITVAALGNAVGGSGLGVDAVSQLWSVSYAGGAVALTRGTSSGVLASSTTLPSGDNSLPWSVFFDTAGNAYAIGSTMGGSGADLVAVDRVSSTTATLISTTAYDSGYSNNNYVFASAAARNGTAWIVGAVQTSGPISGEGTYALAIWNFNPTTGLVQLTTATTRAGFDVGTSVAVDGSGNLWISGYSQPPDPLSALVFDLAVWEYAPDGHTLLAGPFIRQGFLSNFDTSQIAAIALSSGNAYVAATRADPAGGTSIDFLVLGSSGQVVSESAWQPGDGSSATPASVVQDPNGNFVAAGSFVYSDGTIAGLWRYGASGALSSAVSLNAGGARGAAYDNGSLWLMTDGSTTPFLDAGEVAVVVAFDDIAPPRTSLLLGAPNLSSAPYSFVGENVISTLTAVDDAYTVGDGLGVGVASTFIAIDTTTFSVYSGTFSLVAEGTHTVSYFSIDLDTNVEVTHSSEVAVDLTPPATTLQVQGSSTTDAYGNIDITTTTPISLTAIDPVSNGVTSGVAEIYYLIDQNPFSAPCQIIAVDPAAPNGTCANEAYDGAFTLAVGTHTVYYFSEDNVGNQELLNVSSFNVSGTLTSPYALNPSTGPIGVPFTLSGPGGFGSYAGSSTQLFVGTVTAPLSLWNDTTIQGTIPGLSTGIYVVTISTPGSGGAIFAGNFTVTALSSATLSPASGPIGTPFTFTGASFGPYAGALTTVLVGGTTSPLSVWNDNQISGNIPFVSSGTQNVVIQRTASGGGIETSAAYAFSVTVPTITTISPSSGPIGVSYTLTGASFGTYEGALTQVLIGGATTSLSVWNNTAITGTVPGGLTPGTYPVQVEIMASGGGLVLSNTTYFQVTGINLVSVTPSSGPIGVPYSLSGSGFGAYAGANTQVLIGGTTTTLSVWNDTNIQGNVPALATGTYNVVVERLQGASMVYSAPSSFTVIMPTVSTLTPTADPIGTAFMITGAGFGPYQGANTLVRFGVGGSTASLSVWNNTTISGTVPALSTGSYPVFVELTAGSTVEDVPAGTYTVVAPTGALSPSTGPVNVPFTISGSGFGNYSGAATQVRFGVGGSTAPLSVWNDTTISGNVPYLSTGAYAVLVERVSGGTTNDTFIATFTVIVPSIASVVPSSGPIGAPFTVSGSGFGPYTGSGTQLLFGSVAAPLSVWNDSTVSGSVPGSLSGGTYSLSLLFTGSGGAQSVSAGTFTVVVPVISSITPNTGSAGDGVLLTGSGFGAYQGAASNVLVAGSTVSLSVWNDTEIVWTVPSSLANGTDAVVVSLSPSGGSVQSSSVAFTVTGSGGGGGGGQGFLAFRPGFNIVSKPAVALADQPDWYFQGDLVFSTNVVAAIVTPSGAAVKVPAGVLTKTSPLTLQRLPAASLAASNAAMAKQGLAAVGSAIEFGPTGLAFSQPVTITLPYDPSLVTTGELGAVAIYYFDPVADSWSALPTQLVSGQYTLTTQTGHFSRYQPLHNGPLSPAIGGGGAFDVFGLRASYAFPNPSHHGAAVDLRIQPGLADSVDLHVYNSSGKRVLSTTLTAVNFIDDGNGLGPQDTYDYVWDVGGIGSGVYTFVFDAHRAGEHDVIATGKIGVIK